MEGDADQDENEPTPKFTYPRTRQEMEGDADQDENEPTLPAARAKTHQTAAPLQQHNAQHSAQHNTQQYTANDLNPYGGDPAQLQSAYMAGMAAQSWLQMAQFNPMAGFYPPFYPSPGVPQMGAAADIPALLASMGMQVPEIPPVDTKEKTGVPLAALTSLSSAPFMDVSNVMEAQPSPTKSKASTSSPVRRGPSPVPDQENPQVVA